MTGREGFLGLTGFLVGDLTGFLAGFLAGTLAGALALAGALVSALVGFLASALTGFLAGFLVGFLLDFLPVFTVGRFTRFVDSSSVFLALRCLDTARPLDARFFMGVAFFGPRPLFSL